MTTLTLAPFKGMLPKVAERLLGDGGAVDATNVDLTSGEIVPVRRAALAFTPAASEHFTSVYRAEYRGAEHWLTWLADVDVVRGPLPPTVEPRFYWSGDGAPRMARFSGLPGAGVTLGIPAPRAAASVSPSGGTGADVTRSYVYTFYSADNEEGPWSPAAAPVTGKIDGAWAITGLSEFPANTGTGSASFAGGVTTFTNSGAHWLRSGDLVAIGVQTLAASVTGATTFTVPGDLTGATAWARAAPWNTAGMKRRLYRSAGSNASYQLVADDVGVSHTDTLSDADLLGDELISAAWSGPPAGLAGLISLPNGALAGFVGNQLCFSEPYQPHAWPIAYQREADSDIVGIAAYGTTVVVATTGVTYTASGTEPASVTMDSVGHVWPCLSKRSVVTIGDGVLFATRAGLAYVGQAGPSIWTQALMERRQWEALNPASMRAAEADGKVYVRYSAVDGGEGTLVFAPADADLGLVRLSAAPSGLYKDARNGRLYLVQGDGIYEFDAIPGTAINYSWRSKVYSFPTPINFGAVEVLFESVITQNELDAIQADEAAKTAENAVLLAGYAGVGAVNGGRVNGWVTNGSNLHNIGRQAGAAEAKGVTFTLFCDGRAVYSRVLVAGGAPFRLPAGFRAHEVAVALSGSVRVHAVRLAETMMGLKAV